LKVLKDDKRAIFTAASHAQKLVALVVSAANGGVISTLRAG
jgi:antirestriction protein ArdC